MGQVLPIEIHMTDRFRRWLFGLADSRARTRIGQRLTRLEAGLLGDMRPLKGRLCELNIDYGPGYRIYFYSKGR